MVGSSKKTIKNKKYTNADMKVCEKKYCKKEVKKTIKNIDNMTKFLIDKQKKELANAMKLAKTKEEKTRVKIMKENLDIRVKQMKNNKTMKEKQEKLLDGCKKAYCNIDCKGTLFESGKKLPDSVLTVFKDKQTQKIMKPMLEAQRKKIFANKINVLHNNFYEKINPTLVKKYKAEGALSACVLDPELVDKFTNNVMKT
jgi:hypothetical protein